jgi:hypothetical protein
MYKSAETVNTDDEDASPTNSTGTSTNTQNNTNIDNNNQVDTNINTGAVVNANTNSDTSNLFNPSTSFNFFDFTVTNRSLLLQYELSPDEMLANLDKIFGPVARYS